MNEKWWLSVTESGTFGAPPARDMEIADGQKMKVGDTEMTFYVTPGHTDGVLGPYPGGKLLLKSRDLTSQDVVPACQSGVDGGIDRCLVMPVVFNREMRECLGCHVTSDRNWGTRSWGSLWTTSSGDRQSDRRASAGHPVPMHQ